MSTIARERVMALDSQNPWPGLEQFHEEDAVFFRGRDVEAEELLTLVRRERLTVLCGLSGLGKSSLLQAGLFPRLRAEQYLPVYLRVAFHDGAPSPREQVLAALANAAEHDEVEAPSADPDQSLWVHFHRQGAAYWTADNEVVTPVLVIDQFEEAFTLGRQTPERTARERAFLEELADLVEGRVPRELRAALEAEPGDARQYVFNRHPYKVLISIREDFLAELEPLRALMPSLAGNRMRLVALRGDAAITVTQAGGPTLVPPDAAEWIVRLVAGDFGSSLGEHEFRDLIVDPALLSLFCRELNERRKLIGVPSISTALAEGSRDSILSEFYERSVDDLGADVRRLVEDRLITEIGGYRDSLALENALASPGVTAAAVDALVERRLVRREDNHGRSRLELTHDVLTDVVRRSRDARRGHEELARARETAEKQKAELMRARRELRRARAMMAMLALAPVLCIAAGAAGVFWERSRAEYATERLWKVNTFSDVARTQADSTRPDALAYAASALRHSPADASWRALAFALLSSTAAPMHVLTHRGDVTAIAFSPDGRRVLTVAKDAAQQWDVVTGQRLGPPLQQIDVITGAAFNEDGRLIVTSSYDSTAVVWDAATGRRVGRPLRHGTTINSVAFSPHGRYVVTTTFDGTAQVWNWVTGQPVGPRLQHALEVTNASFSPDERRVLTASDDKTARIWDAASGRPVTPPLQHREAVQNAWFSRDGRFVITTSDDYTARLWDAATGRLLHALKHKGVVFDGRFSADGKRVVTSSDDNTAQVWDVATGLPMGPPLRHRAAVRSAVFVPGGRLVVTASVDSTAQVWDAVTGERVGPSLRHRGAVNFVAVSPDGLRILTGSSDSTARIWKMPTRVPSQPELPQRGLVNSVAFSPDGHRAVVASDDGTAQVWDLATGERIGPPLHHDSPVYTAAFSPDGRLVITASADGTAQIWDARTGQRRGAPLQHDDGVRGAAFAPDGRRVITVSGNSARLWDVQSATPVGVAFHNEHLLNSVAFSPDGRYVVTASADSTAQVWDAATREPRGPALRHDRWVNSAVFSPDGKEIVTASADGTAQIWDAKSGERLGPPLRHARPVNFAAFSPKGGRVITASADGTAQMWDAEIGAPIGPAMRHRGPVMSAAFSPDGQELLTADDRSVVLWDVRTGEAEDAISMARFAEAVSQRRMNEMNAIVPVVNDSARAILDDVRRRADAAPRSSDSFNEFVRWYFADPSSRAPFAGAPVWTRAR